MWPCYVPTQGTAPHRLKEHLLDPAEYPFFSDFEERLGVCTLSFLYTAIKVIGSEKSFKGVSSSFTFL